MNLATGSSEFSAEEIIDAVNVFQSLMVSGKKLSATIFLGSLIVNHVLYSMHIKYGGAVGYTFLSLSVILDYVTP